MSGDAYFYHLTRQSLEQALPQLLDRCAGRGWRVLVRGTDPKALDRLDAALWVVPGDDSFLPHGRDGTGFDADQPVLLTQAADGPPANGAACLMAVSGADVAPAEFAAYERVCVLFDGNDDQAVQTARAQWKSLTGAGVVAQYWAQDGGRWEKRAESGTPGA